MNSVVDKRIFRTEYLLKLEAALERRFAGDYSRLYIY